MNDICKLCLKNHNLKLSHIVPKFVFKWLKESVPGGIRMYRNPNQRIQDGPKCYLLCSECEQRFSSWEKTFCETVFLPLHIPEPLGKPIYYEGWALKFAVSVSWRAWTFFNIQSPMNHLTPLQRQLANEAVETWRKFLLEELDHPGRFEQHLLPTDVIENYQGPKISPFLNRYMLRNVHLDVISTSRSAYIYTKMCRVILFGRIQEERPKSWNGMQLHLCKGDIRPRSYLLPAEIVDYMNDKAGQAKIALESLSSKQYELIDSEFHKNVDAIANSEVFRAMRYDVAHSGTEAFSRRRRNPVES